MTQRTVIVSKRITPCWLIFEKLRSFSRLCIKKYNTNQKRQPLYSTCHPPSATRLYTVGLLDRSHHRHQASQIQRGSSVLRRTSNTKTKMHLKDLGKHFSLALWPHYAGNHSNRAYAKEERLRELPCLHLFV